MNMQSFSILHYIQYLYIWVLILKIFDTKITNNEIIVTFRNTNDFLIGK